MNAYLDNAATTQVCPEAAEAALRMMTENYGNPSSGHGPGREAAKALQKARADIAAPLGVKADEIYFTAGGTEADNWALLSGAHLQRHKGKHIISSLTEHDAVRKSLDRLESLGYEVTRLTPHADGAIHAQDVQAALRQDTILVSLMAVNNETGVLNDIAAISRAMRESACPALLHTDAVQAYMKMPVTAAGLGADMISLSAHKINAPKGTGALYIRKGLHLPPLIVGGGQEDGLRAGTECLPGICAFAAAVNAARPRFLDDAQAMAALQSLAIEKLTESCPELRVIGGGAPHILCLSLPGYRSEVLLNFLDEKGVCVSKGSACKKGARSHVLETMNLPAPIIDGAIRVSFCRFTTEAEILYFCDCLTQAHDTLVKTKI